jgi:hypothetical protein
MQYEYFSCNSPLPCLNEHIKRLTPDGSVGYMPTAALRAPGKPPTHRVGVLRALVFPGPSIRLPPREGLSLGCRLVVTRIEGPLAVTDTNGFVPACISSRSTAASQTSSRFRHRQQRDQSATHQ